MSEIKSPEEADFITTQQAADVLNISHQYLLQLLAQEELPFTQTGKSRRIRMEHVLGFKQRRDFIRREKLREITRITQEACGYPELDSQSDEE